jgi:hypothetical protein
MRYRLRRAHALIWIAVLGVTAFGLGLALIARPAFPAPLDGGFAPASSMSRTIAAAASRIQESRR